MARPVGFKLTFHADIPLKKTAGDYRAFVLLIPPTCEKVEDVKAYIVKEFCRDIGLDSVDLRVDSFVMRDTESVELIRFYGDKDKVLK